MSKEVGESLLPVDFLKDLDMIVLGLYPKLKNCGETI